MFSILMVAGCLSSYTFAEVIELNGLYGTIRTDGYPRPYGDDVNKTWRITVREGYRVHLYFTTFDLEDSYEDDIGACAYDYVQVRFAEGEF